MTSDMQQLENKIGGVETKVDEIGKDVKDMKTLLQGNKFDKSDNGMIGDVGDLNSRVTKLEKFKDRGIYLLVGLSFGAGWGLSDFLVKLFK